MAVASQCPRFGKLFGCKFSPRYDTVSATAPDANTVFWTVGLGDGKDLPRATPAKTTYVRDVCERCGMPVERT